MTSTIKVNKIEKVDGSTIEIGGPGTAVNLACGSTQTGFGRTGTVNWCSTAKTAPLTVASGNGYFVERLQLHFQVRLLLVLLLHLKIMETLGMALVKLLQLQETDQKLMV